MAGLRSLISSMRTETLSLIKEKNLNLSEFQSRGIEANNLSNVPIRRACNHVNMGHRALEPIARQMGDCSTCFPHLMKPLSYRLSSSGCKRQGSLPSFKLGRFPKERLTFLSNDKNIFYPPGQLSKGKSSKYRWPHLKNAWLKKSQKSEFQVSGFFFLWRS